MERDAESWLSGAAAAATPSGADHAAPGVYGNDGLDALTASMDACLMRRPSGAGVAGGAAARHSTPPPPPPAGAAPTDNFKVRGGGGGGAWERDSGTYQIGV